MIIIMLSLSAGTSKNKKYRSTRLRVEGTICLYSVIQRCQMNLIFVFIYFIVAEKKKIILEEK